MDIFSFCTVLWVISQGFLVTVHLPLKLLLLLLLLFQRVWEKKGEGEVT